MQKPTQGTIAVLGTTTRDIALVLADQAPSPDSKLIATADAHISLAGMGLRTALVLADFDASVLSCPQAPSCCQEGEP